MYNLLSIFNLVISLAVILGSILAFKHGFTRTANEIQERVINALNSELASLTHRLDSLEKENLRLNLVLNIIINAMKRKKILINIEADLISIQDEINGETVTERIQEESHSG